MRGKNQKVTLLRLLDEYQKLGDLETLGKGAGHGIPCVL